MTDRFKVGDIVLWFPPSYPEYRGMEAEIIGGNQMRNSRGGSSGMRYEIDVGAPLPAKIGSPSRTWNVSEEDLKPLPPHTTPATWEDCVWRPDEVTA